MEGVVNPAINPSSAQNFWITIAERSAVARLTTVACFVWVLWDWLSTLDEEVNYIWLKKRSTSKFLYFITRYFGLLLLAFEMMAETKGWIRQFCTSYYYIIGISTTLLLYIIEIGMQFRVYAMYNCSKKVLITNGLIFFAEVTVVSTMLALDLHYRNHAIPTPHVPHLHMTGCWNFERPKFTFINWIIALAYELYLFGLVAYKAFQKYHQYGTMAGIFRLMFRDAMIWFVFIAGLLAWNAFSFFDSTNAYVFLGLPFLHAGATIGGSRLLLNLGKAYYVTKGDDAVILGVSGSFVNVDHKPTFHHHEMNTFDYTPSPLRTYPTTSTTALAAVGIQFHRHAACLTPSTLPSCPASPSWVSHRSSQAGFYVTNALQIDFGLNHGGFGASDDGDQERTPSTYYSYADAWATQASEAWDDVSLDDRDSTRPMASRAATNGRTNGMTRDWRLRSRSRSASRSSKTRRL